MGSQSTLNKDDIIDDQYEVIDKYDLHSHHTLWELLDLDTGARQTVDWWELIRLFIGR